jgi:hypothetical protein
MSSNAKRPQRFGCATWIVCRLGSTGTTPLASLLSVLAANPDGILFRFDLS